MLLNSLGLFWKDALVVFTPVPFYLESKDEPWSNYSSPLLRLGLI